MTGIIDKILEKKELRGIPRETISEFLKNYTRKHNLEMSNLDSLSNNSKKLIVKEARAYLRTLVGRFQVKESKRNKLLEREDWQALLKTHSSTKERITFYNEVKSCIYSTNPKSILDLGCGLNPIALAKPGIEYNASDINSNDLDIVRAFFKANNISGKVFQYDLTSLNKPLPKSDIVLMFKLLDFLEKFSPKITHRLLDILECKHIIVSFSTSKLSGKRMSHPERKWFENICIHKNLSFRKLVFDNEIFYIIDK